LHTPKQNTKVLVAPLDWGLGHATRCIPLIKALLASGYEVILAGEGPQASLLQSEFPGLTLLPLRGYRVTYSKRKSAMVLKLLWQLPKIWQAIRFEKRWLQQQIGRHSIQLVISDNRYGLHHPLVKSIFITHQLTIKAPIRVVEKWMQQIQYRLIQSFTICWIPDIAGLPNAAGILSHPQLLPSIPTQYIGWLSRFRKQTTEPLYSYCIILSGPEPQRSQLEAILLDQLKTVTEKVLFIRGLPGEKALPSTAENIICKNHLPQEALQKALLQSEWIISRSGYTTVMELLCLQKRAILIPTPGQTEQEYLAERLHTQHRAYAIAQSVFEWHTAIREAAAFRYEWPEEGGFQSEMLPAYINQVMNE
jgi:hypothetical protein